LNWSDADVEMPDEEILRRLLALNLARKAAEAAQRKYSPSRQRRLLPPGTAWRDVAPMCYSGRVFQPLENAMSTTTIRMPEDLKARVAAAAKRADTSTHGFILEAIAEKAAQEDLRADFDAVAEDRYAGIVASGKTIPWQEMRGYLEERLAGKRAKRPVARKLAR
jgi:predicted transcriptional regulator